MIHVKLVFNKVFINNESYPKWALKNGQKNPKRLSKEGA